MRFSSFAAAQFHIPTIHVAAPPVLAPLDAHLAATHPALRLPCGGACGQRPNAGVLVPVAVGAAIGYLVKENTGALIGAAAGFLLGRPGGFIAQGREHTAEFWAQAWAAALAAEAAARQASVAAQHAEAQANAVALQAERQAQGIIRTAEATVAAAQRNAEIAWARAQAADDAAQAAWAQAHRFPVPAAVAVQPPLRQVGVNPATGQPVYQRPANIPAPGARDVGAPTVVGGSVTVAPRRPVARPAAKLVSAMPGPRQRATGTTGRTPITGRTPPLRIVK